MTSGQLIPIALIVAALIAVAIAARLDHRDARRTERWSRFQLLRELRNRGEW